MFLHWLRKTLKLNYIIQKIQKAPVYTIAEAIGLLRKIKQVEYILVTGEGQPDKNYSKPTKPIREIRA
jgi:hypothetical protein